MSEQNKVMLVILDGWGIKENYPGNAIAQAKKPFYDSLLKKYPHTQLAASGEAIGLPPGQMGTSEVNHFTMGAGRVILQDLVRLHQVIDDGSFYQNPALLAACEHAHKNQSALHVWGLISDGGVHSHINHVVATVKVAQQAGLKKVYVHMVTDGRDTSPHSGVEFATAFEAELDKIGVGKIVSVIGRYYAMDREKNWDRTEKAYQLYTQGQGESFSNVKKAIQASYESEITDEYLEPVMIDPDGVMKENDALIMVNFRNDRPRQLAELLLKNGPKNLFITTMTQYHPDYPVQVAYPPVPVKTTLGKIISEAGLKQLRVTETEKFAHLTFFFNCEKEEPYAGEERVMFDSYSDIKTHDQRPQMRAPEIAQQIVSDIEADKYEVIITNICNADIVGHTGNIPAAIKACEAVDAALSQIVPVALEHGFTILITADHGNAEEMLTEPNDGSQPEMVTSHSINPVPLIMVTEKYEELSHGNGQLIDLTATILTILGLTTPDKMTGKSFI
jgi:2,3-bisphosphoglycerate-independent phosphoglycerate mutase